MLQAVDNYRALYETLRHAETPAEFPRRERVDVDGITA
jgi:hypothetical protein